MTSKIFITVSIGAVLTTGGLAACATSADDGKPKGIAAFKGDPRLGEEVSKICFNRSIDGFSENTDRTVVLTKGVNKDHIVEVSRGCRDLKFAQSIAVDSRSSCVTRGDYLLVSDSAFSLDNRTGMGPDRCYIQKMHKWDKKAESDDEVEDEDG